MLLTANGQFQSEKRTTNIVMVDDMKTLKSLANTAKKLEEATLAAAGKSGSVLESRQVKYLWPTRLRCLYLVFSYLFNFLVYLLANQQVVSPSLRQNLAYSLSEELCSVRVLPSAHRAGSQWVVG